MMNDAQREFFRKFLSTNDAEDAFNFVVEMQVLNKIVDPNKKLSKISSIKDKYLPEPDRGKLRSI